MIRFPRISPNLILILEHNLTYVGQFRQYLSLCRGFFILPVVDIICTTVTLFRNTYEILLNFYLTSKSLVNQIFLILIHVAHGITII